MCPNLENENGLETVLEVPIPEESFKITSTHHSTEYAAEIQLLLGVVGAPLVPLPITCIPNTIINPIFNAHSMVRVCMLCLLSVYLSLYYFRILNKAMEYVY